MAGEGALKPCVIDSSVAVKWFSQEPGTEEALVLRDEAFSGKRRFEAPDLLLYELANALKHNPRFTAEDVKLALGSLLDMGILLFPADGHLLSRAVDLAFRYRTTVYDGCFISLAEIRGFPLITADEKLIARARPRANLLRLSEAVR